MYKQVTYATEYDTEIVLHVDP